MITLPNSGLKKLAIVFTAISLFIALAIGGFLLYTLWDQRKEVDSIVRKLGLSQEYRITEKRSDQLICWTSECATSITWTIPKSSRDVFNEVVEKLKHNGFSRDDDQLYFLGNPKRTDFSFQAFYKNDTEYYRLQVIIDDGLADGQAEYRTNVESKLIIQFQNLNNFTF